MFVMADELPDGGGHEGGRRQAYYAITRSATATGVTAEERRRAIPHDGSRRPQPRDKEI